MIVVGLTGGIASGKSTVASIFAEIGARILSADDDAREVLSATSPVLDRVRHAFPKAVNADGSIDRAALARIIFGSAPERTLLDSIMHPAIEARMIDAIAAARSGDDPRTLVYEVPLLFENALERLFDFVVTVVAPADQQRKWLQDRELQAGRPPLSNEAIAERIEAQLSSDVKASRANFVIHNDSGYHRLHSQVALIWTEVSRQSDDALRQ